MKTFLKKLLRKHKIQNHSKDNKTWTDIYIQDQYIGRASTYNFNMCRRKLGDTPFGPVFSATDVAIRLTNIAVMSGIYLKEVKLVQHVETTEGVKDIPRIFKDVVLRPVLNGFELACTYRSTVLPFYRSNDKEQGNKL